MKKIMKIRFGVWIRKAKRSVAAFVGAIVLFGMCPPALAQADIDIHGYLSTKYRLRATDEWSDQDIYQYVGLDVGDPLADRITGHLFARGTADIDGRQDTNGFYVFDSITDTYDENFDFRLYYAYLDIHRVANLKKARIGRQIMYDAPVVIYFDGGLAETIEFKSLANFQVGVYGGIPTHLYESYENNTQEDVIGGAFIKVRPWKGGKIGVHWTHVEDEYLYGKEKNDFYAFEIWQALSQRLRVHAKYTRIEEEDRDVIASASFYDPGQDLMIQGSYYELLETEKNRAVEFDPFYVSAREYFPYRQYRLLASKGIGEHVSVEGGFDMRSLKDEGDRSNYNHEFFRYFAVLYLIDFPVDGLEISGTGEVWDSKDQIEQIESYGGEVSYEFIERAKASLGTYYSLYKYDYYLNKEKDRVQTYYAGLKYSPREGFGFKVNYEYENDDFDDKNFKGDEVEKYQTLKVELKYSF